MWGKFIALCLTLLLQGTIWLREVSKVIVVELQSLLSASLFVPFFFKGNLLARYLI